MRLHAIILLSSTVLSLSFASQYFLVIAVSFSFLNFYFQHQKIRGSFKFVFEAANLVSTTRLLAMLFILFSFPWLSNLQIAIISFLVLLADGLDGYLARKYNTASDFGAYLDMETDAFFVLCLTYIIYQLDLFGWWVLLIGLLRYGYFLLILFIKPPEQKERRVFRAQLIAVILMGSLIACFILPSRIYEPLFVVASILVVYSFGDGFWDIIFKFLKAKK